ncbi:MAG: hypothetical protein LBQ70_04385 [Prevotellaceae bacterium]|jgi:hypothetical protein|nr:hypothetical protein [Prevotellaceae bacterium]
MKGLEKLELTTETKKLLQVSEQNYRRFARIYFQVLSCEPAKLTVKVWQLENPIGKYLTSQELIARTREVFAVAVPPETAIHVRPISFKKMKLENFTLADIERGMSEFGLQPKDLVKLLNLDKSTISQILSGRSLTKSNKAMFYYLFEYLKTEKNTVPKAETV